MEEAFKVSREFSDKTRNANINIRARPGLRSSGESTLQEPSQNFHNGASTTEVAVEIRRYENQRSYNQAVPDMKGVQEAECCWDEVYQPPEFHEDTEQLCDDAVYNFCTTKLY